MEEIKKVRDRRIINRTALISPMQLRTDIPQTADQRKFVLESREIIERILRGEDRRMIIIVGPCSIHDKESAMEYARRLKILADQVKDRYFLVMRTYFDKPRTKLGWEGLINDPHLNAAFKINEGLHLARAILHDITNLGIPCATEFVDSSIIPDYIAEYISWAAIGARTVESRDHRNLASGLSMPVGFKNDRAGHIGAAVDAIITARNPRTFLGGTEYGGHAIVSTTGNDCTHIVLRGGEKEPNYDKAHVAEAQELLRKSDLPPTIIVDCSHGNSSKDHRKQPIVFKDVIKQRKEGNLSIVGVMIESHIKEGQFKIPDDLKGFDKSVIPFGISGTDACIGWDDTEDLIKNS